MNKRHITPFGFPLPKTTGYNRKPLQSIREKIRYCKAKNMRHRSPERWRELVDKIRPIDLRRQVACVVWFEFFSMPCFLQRWGWRFDFQDLLELDRPREMVPPDDVERELIRMGYERGHAKTRLESYRKIYDQEETGRFRPGPRP